MSLGTPGGAGKIPGSRWSPWCIDHAAVNMTEWLRRDGGIFDLALTLGFGKTQFVGKAPEIEDRLFDPNAVCLVESFTTQQLVDRCAALAADSLRVVFGPELLRAASGRGFWFGGR
jgi:hypothetical protein